MFSISNVNIGFAFPKFISLFTSLNGFMFDQDAFVSSMFLGKVVKMALLSEVSIVVVLSFEVKSTDVNL
jgi:hypothetical protein